jgi:hypothetical protein
MDRRMFLRAGAVGVAGLNLDWADAGEAGETLYNGIRLPARWPPRIEYTREPMAMPYLRQPPALIPIDVGRQLFVDNFLIAETTLARTLHAARYHEATPVLRPDRPWEMTGQNPCAMVFSDGVWFDLADNLFKIWYMGGLVRSTCYATSRDGIKWEKPRLDVHKDTNIVVPGYRDSNTVWLDHNEKDENRRFKMFRVIRGKRLCAIEVQFSADGIHWSKPVRSGPCGDRTTVFYNPFRRRWVYGVRDDAPRLGRVRAYREHADVLAAARWQAREPTPWIGADRLDPIRQDLRTPCQLYNLDGVAYESLLLGLFTIWRGQPNNRAKPNEVCIGFSRDGFHWDRPSHRAFCPVSEHHGDWNWGNVQSAGGCCLVVGDQLFFYVSGRAGIKGSTQSGVCTTGLAVLRRDGFASMDAGKDAGTLTTRAVSFRGRHCFVNVDCPRGELRVEVLDSDRNVIAPFSRNNCISIRVDRTRQRIAWKGADDLAKLAGQPVRFRFHLTNGKLYAFWVSTQAGGGSHGYVAAGGPGFKGPLDTIGGSSQD